MKSMTRPHMASLSGVLNMKSSIHDLPPYNQKNVLILFKRQQLNSAFETYKLTSCIQNMNCLGG